MLMIFGANGPSGRQLIHQLDRLERETTVAALRLPEQQADEFFADHHIRTTVADALDAEATSTSSAPSNSTPPKPTSSSSPAWAAANNTR